MNESSTSAAGSEPYLLSVVLPIFNEEQCAVECVQRLQAVMAKLKCRYELLFVNDGSTDRTLEILRAEKKKDGSIKILNFSRNFGHQPAITAGLDHAKGDAVVILDSDLQDPPEFIIDLVEKWQEGYDVIHAQRLRRQGDPALKKVLANLYYRFLRNISEIELPVDVGDFRLISRQAADAIKTLHERHRYIRGLMCWVGFKQTIIQYERHERFSGDSKFSLAKQAKFALSGIFSFSTFPMRIATYVGVTLVLAATAVLIWAMLAKFSAGFVAGLWTVFIIAVLFIGGLQMICLGVLGEYIGFVYEETKRRPLYFLSGIE